MFFVFFLILSTVVWAQLGTYDQFPRMRSYLSRPETGSNLGTQDMSVPRITGEDAIRKGVEELPEEKLLEIPRYKEILFDRTIDPDRYIVGPGDILSVYLWGELDKEFTDRITPPTKFP